MRRIDPRPWARGLALLTLLAAVGCGGGSTAAPPPASPLSGFLLGTSQGGLSVLPIAVELGTRWMRAQVTWRGRESTVDALTLTVADVDANPSLVADYLSRTDWTAPDAHLLEMARAGLQPLVIVGHGYAAALPQWKGEVITPDRVGRAQYLGHLYLLARATVERYDGDGVLDAPDGQVVKLWQLENELNQAFFTALWGWREPSFAAAQGSAWQDDAFVTELLTTLRRAVKTEDPTALVTVNFHTDVPEALNRLFGLPGWPESIERWRDLVDIVGLDAYPNYYEPDPVRGTELGDRVRIARERGGGKPVVVIETGYPSGPAERGYDEAKQALYVRQAYDAARAAGAEGFFLFGVRTGEVHDTEITEEDRENLAQLSSWYDAGQVLPLVQFALSNEAYVQDHFVDVLQTVEPYWGLVRADGQPKAAFGVFAGIADEVSGAP